MEVHTALSGTSRIYLSGVNNVCDLLIIHDFNLRLMRWRPLYHLMRRNIKIILLLFLYFNHAVLKNLPNVTFLRDNFKAASPVRVRDLYRFLICE
jgi:hypothetical protein